MRAAAGPARSQRVSSARWVAPARPPPGLGPGPVTERRNDDVPAVAVAVRSAGGRGARVAHTSIRGPVAVGEDADVAVMRPPRGEASSTEKRTHVLLHPACTGEADRPRSPGSTRSISPVRGDRVGPCGPRSTRRRLQAAAGRWSGRWDSNPHPRAPKARAPPLRHTPTSYVLTKRMCFASNTGSLPYSARGAR
jgi:hypothetical protein